MKRQFGIVSDYILNALKSAVIGALVSIVITLSEGESALWLGFVGECAFIGVVCGTCSKAVIEGVFALFGAPRFLAYVLNALIIGVIVLILPCLIFGGFDGIKPWVIVLVFALPEAGSIFIVRAGLAEAESIERALEQKRAELEEKNSP
jgi:hypothetical protein